jgi:hypothetical protein
LKMLVMAITLLDIRVNSKVVKFIG